jgi:hypothetical protein
MNGRSEKSRFSVSKFGAKIFDFFNVFETGQLTLVFDALQIGRHPISFKYKFFMGLLFGLNTIFTLATFAMKTSCGYPLGLTCLEFRIRMITICLESSEASMASKMVLF